MNRLEREAHADFVRKVTRAPCVMCAQTGKREWGGGKRREAHHVITQEAIKAYVASLGLSPPEARTLLLSLLWDRRNGLSLCSRHHQRHTKAVERVPRERVPQEAWQFARELGLDWQIERYYPAA